MHRESKFTIEAPIVPKDCAGGKSEKLGAHTKAEGLWRRKSKLLLVLSNIGGAPPVPLVLKDSTNSVFRSNSRHN